MARLHIWWKRKLACTRTTAPAGWKQAGSRREQRSIDMERVSGAPPEWVKCRLRLMLPPVGEQPEICIIKP